MKYKVDDKVRIKSLGWYIQNKDKLGNVPLPKLHFVKNMSDYCGSILSIAEVHDDGYIMRNVDYMFTDDMIDCLIEPKKYRVGDKVLVKSFEWYGKYKDWEGFVYFGQFYFDRKMSEYCGKEVTIDAVYSKSYGVDGNDYMWTDDMFEGIAEKYGTLIWNGNNLHDIIDLIGLYYSVKGMPWEQYEELVRENGLKICIDGEWHKVEIGDVVKKTKDGISIYSSSFQTAMGIDRQEPQIVDIAAILKDCPERTKLWSSITGEVYLVKVKDTDARYPIYVLNKFGTMDVYDKEGFLKTEFKKYGAEPALYPSRECRDWTKFKNPCPDLPIDTPVMVLNNEKTCTAWKLYYYAGKSYIFEKGKSNECDTKFQKNYIIPFDKFNPDDLKSNLDCEWNYGNKKLRRISNGQKD